MAECVHGLEVSTCATCSPTADELVGSRSDTLTGFFEKLGAPLNNFRYSWGSRRDDGVIFLRVWDDQQKLVDGTRVVLGYRHIEGYQSSGIPERLSHLDLLREGATGFLVFCTAEDPHHEPRSIAQFKARELNRAGRIIESDGATWIEIGDQVAVDDVIDG